MRAPQPRDFRWIFPPPVIGLAWIIGCGMIDWLTGPEISLSVFYIPGVAVVAWNYGRLPTGAMAFFAAVVWLLVQLSSDKTYSSSFIPYWNAGIRLGFFLITAYLIFEVRARQRTEAALLEQDTILRSILDSMGDAVVVVGSDGNVIAFNPAAKKLFRSNPVGFPAIQWVENMEAFQLDRFTPDAGKPSSLRLAVAGQLSGSSEISLRDIGETKKQVLSLSTHPLLEKQGKPAGVVMVIANLTARRALEQQIAEASEREQRRIGQDLHDGVCQHLVSVAFAAGTLQSTLESLALDKEASAAGEIAHLINEAISEARDLAHGLYPAGLEDGIEVALAALALTTQQRTRISCTASFDGPTPGLDRVSTVHLFRIAQECISNACRHATPGIIEISLTRHNSHLRLTVTDNGKGMDLSSPAGRGIGLNLMRYRSNLIGGSLDIDSKPGDGTTITCTLPSANTLESVA